MRIAGSCDLCWGVRAANWYALDRQVCSCAGASHIAIAPGSFPDFPETIESARKRYTMAFEVQRV